MACLPVSWQACSFPRPPRQTNSSRLPGLWKTTYELEGASPAPREAGEVVTPRVARAQVVWHCVDEQADPWVSFAQLQDLPGMTCSRSSLQRNSTSLRWKTQCRGPGPDAARM